jgi:hypothetical protein
MMTVSREREIAPINSVAACCAVVQTLERTLLFDQSFIQCWSIVTATQSIVFKTPSECTILQIGAASATETLQERDAVRRVFLASAQLEQLGHSKV